MTRRSEFFLTLVCVVGAACVAVSQVNAHLKTSNTEITLQSTDSAPLLTTLTVPGHASWTNRNSEAFIDSAEIAGRPTPIHWRFNREASTFNNQNVAFIYDSQSPHLRLTWEWRTRESYGPIEHQIRIENLESQELWIPLQDSI